MPAWFPAHQHALSLQFEEVVLKDQLSLPGLIHPSEHSPMGSCFLVPWKGLSLLS